MIRIQTTLNNFSVAKTISQLLAEFKDIGYGLNIDANGVIRPVINKCPHCGSSFSDNGHNKPEDRVSKGLKLKWKKGKLICKKCKLQISVPQKVIGYLNDFFLDWFNSEIISLGTKGLSPKSIAKHFEETSIISFSAEYIRQKIKAFVKEIKCPEPQEKPSGIIVHDEQFLKIKGVDFKRISDIDANNPNVYHDKLYSDRTEETMIHVCEELKHNLKEIKAAVMDGHAASRKAFEQVFTTIIIQFCLFHFTKNVRDAYKESVGYGKGKGCIPLNHIIGFFSIVNIFFDHEREINELRRFQKERNENIERVNKEDYTILKKLEYKNDYDRAYDTKAREYLCRVRNARRKKNGIKLTLRTEEQAKEIFEKAKKDNIFPAAVQKQIERLEKNWENFTHCMRDNAIPPTSNKVEQFFGLTLNWILKNNLQSEEEFYQKQKFNLLKRYKMPFFKEGLLANFLAAYSVLILVFGT